MMRDISKYFFLLFSFCVVTESFGQAISGKIVDSTFAPVPYAIVALMHAGDSAVVKGIPTDESGNYSFSSIHPGNYFLKIAATGFDEQYSSEINYDSLTDQRIPPIVLHQSHTLNTATITAIKQPIEFRNGNIIVNVENSALAKGNSIYDLLPRLPGVTVDNNVISIAGKSGVIVMIDGRIEQVSNEQLIILLKSMSAASVERIEILKNPPVKYDAAGTSGMINIITKKNEQRGFSGTVYNETSQGFYNNTSSGIALNYKNEKISIFSSIDNTYNTYLTNTRLYTNYESDSGNTAFANKTGYKILETGLDYKFGCDWYVNKSNVIGFKTDGDHGVYNENGDGADYVTGYNNNGFDHLQFAERGHDYWSTQNYNLNAEHYFDTLGTILDFSADYTNAKEYDHSFYSNYFYDANDGEVLQPNNYQNTNDSRTKIISSKLDFIHPIDTTSSIEAGIKGSYTSMINYYLFERENDSTSLFYTDNNLSNNYLYSEQNLAAYFNYSKSFEFFNVQAGVRGENTSVNSSNTANSFRLIKNYFSLFPDFSLEYNKEEDHDFQLNLNRRIDRPSYWDLTPFIVYRDPYSYFLGNPYLQPHFSNTAELTYSFREMINTSFSFTHINHFMLDRTEQNDTTKILLETSKNIDFRNAFAYLLFVKYDFTDWYEVSFTTNISWVDFKGEIKNVPFRTKGFTYNMNLLNTFILPGETKLEITALYRGPNIYGIVKVNPVWTSSIAAEKSFFHEKLDCSLGFYDIFNTFKFHTHSQFDNQNWNFYQSDDPRRISLSVSYNFGKVKTEERETDSDEQEKERLNH